MGYMFNETLLKIIEVLTYLFVFVVGTGLLLIVIVFVLDISQRRHAIRRNFPVIGRFRDFFEHLGVFFRAYFVAFDREELPFNRAERVWVYRASKDTHNVVPFGSTRDLRPTGTIIFANTAYPMLERDVAEPHMVRIGQHVEYPYETKSFFNISGMSYGAISKPAVLALSNGARLAKIWMNTGEGGLSPYHLEGGADIVFQMGTAKYGVRRLDGGLSEDKLKEVAEHTNVKMFEIKLSQGAKPGKGGILPGEKVTREIAKTRGINIGQSSISPNRHPEIGSNTELLDYVERVRSVTRKPTGFKLVLGSVTWFEELCETILVRGKPNAPDFITVDSADGGTGAAPMSLIDNVGIPIRESLPLVVDTLDRFGLRDRSRIIASGKLITPVEVAWALCVGADFVTSARGFMFALGCIQALQCDKNTCPTGITTHDKKLQKGLDVGDKSLRVMNYAHNVQQEVGIIAHSCGVKEPRELNRDHCRIVQNNGRTVLLSELYPTITETLGSTS